ncbi:hypothetical protein M011DRAFT_456368 [Sporormia fimetaria CBS 119925]|uniref:Mid2 domain-containing protein n=1 Tax=Sporormia fimetaria CBS 119925 TaxID=1340428 RepID=A0A6A6VMR8_9PLEO|nr:hypothetical protein M011DRAFT_456368 [Sporormia fimetaria CBS 119925]
MPLIISPRSLFLLLLLLLIAPFDTFAQKCYALDGTELDTSFKPCNPTAEHSGCCATNRSSGPNDLCLDSGLCMAPAGDAVGTISQAGCTDPTFQAPGCPKVCPDVASTDAAVQAYTLQSCGVGVYCCRASTSTTNCCANASSPKFRPTALGAVVLPSPLASLPIPSPSSTPSSELPASSSTPSPTSAPQSSAKEIASCPTPKQLNIAVLGGAIGSALGSIILALSGVLYLVWKRERRWKRLKEHYEEQFGMNWAYRRTVVVEKAGDEKRRDSEEVESVGVGVGVGAGEGRSEGGREGV